MLTPRTPVERPAPAAAAVSPRGARRTALRHRLLTGSAVLLLAVIAERWFLASQPFPGDGWAAQIGMSHKAWPIWEITRVYQQVGRPLVAVGEVALLLGWLWQRAGRRETHGLLIVLLASATCGVIKILCGPTPLWMVLDHHVGTNFPSGVVTFMTATVGYVALVAWRLGRRLLPLGLTIAILGAGPARVLGGQHLISDVLGGYMLGSAWLLIAYSYVTTQARGWHAKARWRVPTLETLD